MKRRTFKISNGTQIVYYVAILLISITNTQIEIEHTKQKYHPPLLLEPLAKAGVMLGS